MFGKEKKGLSKNQKKKKDREKKEMKLSSLMASLEWLPR